MKKKHIRIGVGILLAASLCLLVGCSSGNKKGDKSKESSSSKSTLSKSSSQSESEVASSENTGIDASDSSTTVPETTQELTTLKATTEGKIALALAKMASLTPNAVSAEQIKAAQQLIFRCFTTNFGHVEYSIGDRELNNPNDGTVGGYIYCLILQDEGFVQYGTQSVSEEDPVTEYPTYTYDSVTADEIQLASTLKDKIVIN